LHFFYPVADRYEELDDEEVEWYTDEESDNSHEMFCDEEYEKYYRGREFQRLSHNSRIQEISLKCVYDEEHSDDADNNTPSWIFDYSSEEDRDPSDKYSQYWHKTREKCDTSESEYVGKYDTTIEAELAIEETDDDESHEGQ
jgi:hypothetical protein